MASLQASYIWEHNGMKRGGFKHFYRSVIYLYKYILLIYIIHSQSYNYILYSHRYYFYHSISAPTNTVKLYIQKLSNAMWSWHFWVKGKSVACINLIKNSGTSRRLDCNIIFLQRSQFLYPNSHILMNE